MAESTKLSKSQFTVFYNSLIKGYSEDFKNIIVGHDELVKNLFKNNEIIEIEDLEKYIDEITDNAIKSLLLRLIAVKEIIHCRDDNKNLNIKEVWTYISKSIKIIPSCYNISSIGSQGFLSIPLYKYDETLETFDFIRLHIFDDSLNELMDLKKCEDFSVHTHTFFAKSWIITGKIINNRYDYILHSENSKHSFFKVKYNDSLNEVNQHTSLAINEKINVELFQTSEEIHFEKGYYEIKPGKLHKSGHKNSPFVSATFFSFTGKDGLDKSIVIGPREIEVSEVNRKMIIDPLYLLEKIDNQLNN
ncbi:hypothetical protein [Flavobacterium sp. LM4]|uniref:hypothetical protein n=1 Tax=Flavobacterium sp. LM4 TaxID=1938609 RepID=UPI0009D1F7EE|nr:hypothetical protein [Flavobacterium sp. LM4]OOV19251.1 hypothetical protein BXU10_06160 [Flavobacterium sp. LM4]